MLADEMLKKLGFIQIQKTNKLSNENSIFYALDAGGIKNYTVYKNSSYFANKNCTKIETYLVFDLDNKRFMRYLANDSAGPYITSWLFLEELQAVNQKFKELGE